MKLIDRLTTLAGIWCKANDRSLARLATIVANDGKMFDRIAAGGSCTLTTFDRFISFFADDSNWPDGVPIEAQSLIYLPGQAA